MIRRCNFLVMLFFAFSVGLSSCKRFYFVHEGFTQGTNYKIKYESPDGVDYERELVQLLKDFSASLSTYDSTSLISRINRNDTTAVVDNYFRTVFDKAAEVNSASNGVFDITIAPIVNFWGFGFTDDKIVNIDAKKIDSLLQYVGMNKIRIKGNRVEKDSQGIMLDVNAIAKGYSADVTANFLKAKGIGNYLVEIGGECVTSGVNESGDWTIAVEKPIDMAAYGEDFQAFISLNNQAIATSGNNRRFIEIDGVKYAHTIDVKTGYPVRHNLLSATVIAQNCITADAWATVCMASGLDKSIRLMQQHPELEALFIYSNENDGKFKVYATEGMKTAIRWLSD